MSTMEDQHAIVTSSDDIVGPSMGDTQSEDRQKDDGEETVSTKGTIATFESEEVVFVDGNIEILPKKRRNRIRAAKKFQSLRPKW